MCSLAIDSDSLGYYITTDRVCNGGVDFAKWGLGSWCTVFLQLVSANKTFTGKASVLHIYRHSLIVHFIVVLGMLKAISIDFTAKDLSR